ncbi:MAG TPA: hypothetical protein VFH30_13985, partial [Acidimicrobiales bacterium]|nr:hypothetical protein [Acidimicrobiales bacterium]
MATQEAGQAAAIGAGAFNTERCDGAVLVGPRQQLGVAVWFGGDGQLVEEATQAVERDGDVFV